MWKLIDDCTTSKATIFEENLGHSYKDAIFKSISVWDGLTSHDQGLRDAFYITNGSVSIDIALGTYDYILRYWKAGSGYVFEELWDNLDYFLPAEAFLDETFVDRDDAVGLRNDGVNVEVYLDGILIDQYFYLKEGTDHDE